LANAFLHIGSVSQRTGVPEATLRAWERRYGILRPERSPGGQRLYSEDDVARVLRLRALIDGGLRTAQAARVIAGDETAENGTGGVDERLRAALIEAAMRADEPSMHHALDAAFARFSLVAALERVVVPALERLGASWECGEIDVGAEHVASNVIRARLAALAGEWAAGAGPRVVAACAPEEQHDLPLLILCIGLRRDGWRVRFLGARTPSADLRRLLAADRPELAVLSAITAAAAASCDAEPGVDGVPVVAGGQGFAGWEPVGLRAAVESLRPYGFPAHR
jgi:MerR family transcriptional regulator, light-induced transcriptional regulator